MVIIPYIQSANPRHPFSEICRTQDIFHKIMHFQATAPPQKNPQKLEAIVVYLAERYINDVDIFAEYADSVEGGGHKSKVRQVLHMTIKVILYWSMGDLNRIPLL